MGPDFGRVAWSYPINLFDSLQPNSNNILNLNHHLLLALEAHLLTCLVWISTTVLTRCQKSTLESLISIHFIGGRDLYEQEHPLPGSGLRRVAYLRSCWLDGMSKGSPRLRSRSGSKGSTQSTSPVPSPGSWNNVDRGRSRVRRPSNPFSENSLRRRCDFVEHTFIFIAK